jgi:hypothetical protein
VHWGFWIDFGIGYALYTCYLVDKSKLFHFRSRLLGAFEEPEVQTPFSISLSTLFHCVFSKTTNISGFLIPELFCLVNCELRLDRHKKKEKARILNCKVQYFLLVSESPTGTQFLSKTI